MIIGVIGSGGREHAICAKILESKKVKKIYCFPGNAGTNLIATNVEIKVDEFEKIKDFVITLQSAPCKTHDCSCKTRLIVYIATISRKCGPDHL